MTRISRRKQKQELAEQKPDSTGPWLSWRTGMRTNTLVSLALALFMIWQIYPAGGLGPALLWGGIAGLSIWGVFFFSYFVSRRLRRK